MADFPEYQCPVCGATMEYERSWGQQGVHTREEHECRACDAVLRINCQIRDRLNSAPDSATTEPTSEA